jgi:dTDP-4-dehydrorhamnose reductase
MDILLIGRAGQVGWELERALQPLGRVTALGRAELDLVDSDAVRARVRETHADVIVNAAAYTAVDQAEREPDSAAAINATAPGVLAEEAARRSALLIHYSTDYVFDGRNNEPYRETDSPNPINVYGRTKWEGEQAIAAAGGRFLILRTSWVYAARGKNFLNTMRRLVRERKTLDVVDDQIGAPTWARMIAEATAQVLAQCVASRIGLASLPTGTFHLTAAGETSWFGFAQAIAAREAELHGPVSCEIRPIPAEQYPSPTRRPRNSRLDNSAFAHAFHLTLPDWEWALRAAMDPGA